MPDSKYCYLGSDVLINKLNIQNSEDLFNTKTSKLRSADGL